MDSSVCAQSDDDAARDLARLPRRAIDVERRLCATRRRIHQHLVAIAPVMSVHRPVAMASAIVVNDELKYECVTQPCSHGPQ